MERKEQTMKKIFALVALTLAVAGVSLAFTAVEGKPEAKACPTYPC